MTALERLWRDERVDLLRLGLCAVTVVGVWVAWLGWRWDLAMAAGDLKAQLRWPGLLIDAGGDWRGVLYDIRVLGGVPLHDAFGTTPLAQLWAVLRVDGVAAANLTVLYLQVALASLGTGAVIDLGRAWSPGSGPDRRIDPWWVVGCTLLFAFSPMVLQRISVYHVNLLTGLLVLAAAVALITRSMHGRPSLTLILWSLFACANGLSAFGLQMVVYGLVFGGPALMALVSWPAGLRTPDRRRPRPWPRLKWAALVIGIALCLMVPRLAGMFDYAGSLDFPRDAGASYANHGAMRTQDWMSSVPWHDTLFGQRGGGHHEKIYGIGPVLLLLGLIPWSRFRPGRWWLGVPVVVAVLFTLRIEPIAGWLNLVPVLRSFQQPGRVLLVLIVLLQIVALAGLWAARHRAPASVLSDRAAAAFTVAAALAAIFVPITAREIAVWVGAAGFVVLARRGVMRRSAALAVLVVLGCAALLAGAERLKRPYFDHQILMAGPQQNGEAVRRVAPNLGEPLDRVRQRSYLRYHAATSAATMGLSGLGGYSNVTRGHRELVEGLFGKKFPLTSGFRFNRQPNLRPLEALYNVTHWLDVRGHRAVTQPAGPSAGRAWFVQGVRWRPNLPGLAKHLVQSAEGVTGEVRGTGWLVGADPRTAPARALSNQGCAESTVRGASAVEAPFSVTLDVSSSGQCLLVVAMNYLERMEAVSAGAPLTTVPVYGALLGIVVPAGDHTIKAGMRPFEPWWATLVWLLGVAAAWRWAWIGVRRLREGES